MGVSPVTPRSELPRAVLAVRCADCRRIAPPAAHETQDRYLARLASRTWVVETDLDGVRVWCARCHAMRVARSMAPTPTNTTQED